jgi:hypothetical protein
MQNKACPTAMVCSSSGNLVFTAFSDNSVKMIDQRAPEKNGVLKIVSLVGGHEDNLVKSLLVS